VKWTSLQIPRKTSWKRMAKVRGTLPVTCYISDADHGRDVRCPASCLLTPSAEYRREYALCQTFTNRQVLFLFLLVFAGGARSSIGWTIADSQPRLSVRYRASTRAVGPHMKVATPLELWSHLLFAAVKFPESWRPTTTNSLFCSHIQLHLFGAYR
jgi:hypothetical protein